MIGFDPLDYLRPEDVYYDSGAGKTCQVVGEVKRAMPSVHAIAIGMHTPETIPPGVVYIPATLPHDCPNLEKIKKARLITDIFGAVSFAELKNERTGEHEPAALETLIRLAGQLAPDGKLVVCTERDRFGDTHAQARIAAFFKDQMGLKCTFEEYEHLAEDRQKNEKQLRVVIESDRDFEHLVRASEEIVGVPRSGRTLWESREENPDDRMRIVETLFEKPVC